jgi:hypothetical protein
MSQHNADHLGGQATPIQAILARLDYHQTGHSYRAACPAHGGDNTTALHITPGEHGKVLLHCHAHGCTYEAILRAIGLWDERAHAATGQKASATKPPRPANLTDEEKLIMALAGREALALMCGPLPAQAIEPELIPPYGGFLEDLWDVYAATGDHAAVQAKYIEMRPALAEAMPRLLRALDRRLKERLRETLPPLDAAPTAAPTFQPYSLADLQREDLPERHWIIEGIIPEGVHLVAGPVGLGKSYWALELCLSVAYGGKAFSAFDVEAGEALYLSLEDDKLGMNERVVNIQEDAADWPQDCYIVHECRHLDTGLVDDLSGWLTTHPRTRLIVIDVLFNVRATYHSKADLYAQDYAVVQALKPLAHTHHVAIILLHHCNKQINPDDPLNAVSGTTGLLAPADVKGVFVRAKGEADIKLYLRGRPIREQWLAFTYRECIWTYLGEAQAVERSQTRQAILAALNQAGGPMSPKKIAEQANIRGDLVRFTLRKMVQAGEVKQVARGSYTLPHTSTYEEEERDTDTHSQHSQCSHTSQCSHAHDPAAVDRPQPSVSTSPSSTYEEEEEEDTRTHSQRSQRSHTSPHSHAHNGRIVSVPMGIVSAPGHHSQSHSQSNSLKPQGKLSIVSAVSEIYKENTHIETQERQETPDDPPTPQAHVRTAAMSDPRRDPWPFPRRGQL